MNGNKIKVLGRYKNKLTKETWYVVGSWEDVTYLEYSKQWNITDRVKTSDFFNKYSEDYIQEELNFN